MDKAKIKNSIQHCIHTIKTQYIQLSQKLGGDSNRAKDENQNHTHSIYSML
jgi:hypothetical protein